ncbi:restriction endonuclease subunit S [Denitratimonas tolerans]|uniref:Restriction endonuclease subunit S n=1 Tax=Denitratimonas tolerans TaxID=1338420 RepID=A0AAW9R855_9GAMM
MVSDWDSVPLSELTATPVTYGIVQPGRHTPGGIPMLRVNNFQQNSLSLSEVLCVSPLVESKYGRTRLQEGDVLLTIVGSVGQVAIVPKHLAGWNIARAIALIRLAKPEYSRWIAFVLRSPSIQHQLGVAANTTVQTTINLKDLRDLRVPLPPKNVRDGICQILGALDDRIDNLRQTNATLEAIAQALFKSWFVDFDPVHAKAEGREPEGMDAATAALFPSEFEDSELGLIPKGWRAGGSDELLEIVGGGTPKTSVDEYWGGDIPWFSVVDAPASGQVFTLDTAKKITALGLANCSAKLLPPTTTIISARGTVGKVAMAGVPMAMNQSCYALRPRVEGGEAFIYFSTLRFVEQLQQIAHGAVFDTVTRDSFKRIMTCLPPEQTIVSFGLMANPLLERIRTNGLQAASLAALRDTLLPRLISGRLRLTEAEAVIEDLFA